MGKKDRAAFFEAGYYYTLKKSKEKSHIEWHIGYNTRYYKDKNGEIKLESRKVLKDFKDLKPRLLLKADKALLFLCKSRLHLRPPYVGASSVQLKPAPTKKWQLLFEGFNEPCFLSEDDGRTFFDKSEERNLEKAEELLALQEISR